MSKTRKTLVITFLVVGSMLILISFFVKLGYWTNSICCAFAFGGFVFAISALVMAMRKSNFK